MTESKIVEQEAAHGRKMIDVKIYLDEHVYAETIRVAR